MIKYIKGDLLNAREAIIAHQVNCFGIAGGLAQSVFEKWPEAELEYKQIVEKTGEYMLGVTQFTKQQTDGHIIANVFGQLYPGNDTRYHELGKALRHLAVMAEMLRLPVALPYKLGCGIGGGSWEKVKEMIEANLGNLDVTIYQR